MSLGDIPALEIFLAVLGFGLLIMFCATFCRACSRLREEEIEREAWRRTEHDGRPPPIYFIPFHGRLAQQEQQLQEQQLQEQQLQEQQLQEQDEHHGVPPYSQEAFTLPQYNTAGGHSGPPPSYTELDFKPDDLPPAYTEYNVSTVTASARTDTAQS